MPQLPADSSDDPADPVGEGQVPTEEPSEAAPPDGPMVVFTIAPGTGRNDWNSPDNPVLVRVGQTLRIVNDDPTEPHALHTNFGEPCRHGTEIKVGAFYDCKIDAPFQTGVNGGDTHDHYRFRNDEMFWIKTIPAP